MLFRSGVNLLISIGIVIFSFVFIKIISILFHPKQSMDRQVLSSQNRIENFTEIIYVLILLLVAFGLRAYYLFVQEPDFIRNIVSSEAFCASRDLSNNVLRGEGYSSEYISLFPSKAGYIYLVSLIMKLFGKTAVVLVGFNIALSIALFL